MIKTVSHITTECRRTDLLRIINKQLKDASGTEREALMWARLFIQDYEFKEGSNGEPIADMLKLFGMYMIYQCKDGLIS